jgi:hypothetical protein
LEEQCLKIGNESFSAVLHNLADAVKIVQKHRKWKSYLTCFTICVAIIFQKYDGFRHTPVRLTNLFSPYVSPTQIIHVSSFAFLSASGKRLELLHILITL